MQPSVFVVILNWNNWKDTLRCLESVYGSDYRNVSVVVCDNGSTDESVEMIKEWAKANLAARDDGTFTMAPCRIGKAISVNIVALGDGENDSSQKRHRARLYLKVIQLPENIGYAAGNNVGIKYAIRNDAGFVFVLNNDTVIDKRCISSFVEFGTGHPEAALMAPRLFERSGVATQFVECDPHPWMHRPAFVSVVFSFLLERLRFAREKRRRNDGDVVAYLPRRLYYAPGCAMMFRAETLAKVGYFDETTFIYYEEFIIAEKMKQVGYATIQVPEAVVWHLKGATTARISSVEKYVRALMSEQYYLVRYFGITELQLSILRTVRVGAYLRMAIINASYRRRLSEFLKEYTSKVKSRLESQTANVDRWYCM